MQRDCHNCATVKWLQDEAEKAEVERLLDELLNMQRRRRAQETAETLLVDMQSPPFLEPQSFDGVEPNLCEGMATTMENFWGRIGEAQYDATDSLATSSSRPPSLSSSFTTSTSAMLPSAEYISAAGASLVNDNQGRVNTGAYDAAPGLPYIDSIPPLTSYPTSSLPKMLARVFSIFGATPKASSGKVSWENRVGRRAKAYGRQLMGQTRGAPVCEG